MSLTGLEVSSGFLEGVLLFSLVGELVFLAVIFRRNRDVTDESEQRKRRLSSRRNRDDDRGDGLDH